MGVFIKVNESQMVDSQSPRHTFGCFEEEEKRLGFTYQPIFADDENSSGTICLCQSNLFIKGAVSTKHHRNAIGKATLRYLGC